MELNNNLLRGNIMTDALQQLKNLEEVVAGLLGDSGDRRPVCFRYPVAAARSRARVAR
jgi:hypothetical protein